MLNDYTQCLATGSGMWGLWDYESYKMIVDYDKWEPLFCEDEDIEKQIAQKAFVPVYTHEDGCRQFTVKIDGALSDREQKYVCAQSGKYLFYSNGRAVVSGIDNIAADVRKEEGIIFDLPKGFYVVSVFLIDWGEEPGAYLEDGSISPNAISDFVVILKSNAGLNKTYCRSIETFSGK